MFIFGLLSTSSALHENGYESSKTQVVNPDDLRHIGQVFLHRPENDRVDLELAVKDFYAPFEQQTTGLHTQLADLPFTLCVNTTHDCFLSNAFKAVGKAPQVAYYNFRKPSPTMPLNPTPDSPVVLGRRSKDT